MRKYSMRLNKVESRADVNVLSPQSPQIEGNHMAFSGIQYTHSANRGHLNPRTTTKPVKISELTQSKKKSKIPVTPMQHPAFLCVFKIGIK